MLGGIYVIEQTWLKCLQHMVDVTDFPRSYVILQDLVCITVHDWIQRKKCVFSKGLVQCESMKEEADH